MESRCGGRGVEKDVSIHLNGLKIVIGVVNQEIRLVKIFRICAGVGVICQELSDKKPVKQFWGIHLDILRGGVYGKIF